MSIPMLKGWDFSEDEIQKAKKNKHMLMLDTETSNICNLNCPYCYRDEYSKKHVILDNELSIEQRKKLNNEAKEIGCKTIKIVGAGEPLADSQFFDQIENIFNSGITPIVYTNGILLTKERAKRLFELNCSIMLKFNSLKNEIQDKLIGRKGYTKLRDKTLKILMDVGFNKSKPTRLGFDSIIVKQNKNEILDMLRYCRKNNIFPSFKTFIPTGGALRYRDWEISKKELIDLYKEAQKIDEKEFGIKYSLSLPYIGGFHCTQWHYALFIDILGNVYACPGSRTLLGNIKEDPLISIWNTSKAREFRVKKYVSCPPREEYWN
ncbi:radical SAM protein [Candidatus Woesearchaeota archaeon]|nr:radical SAM protein [Candidatus Woesearchaeota archaeon]